MTEGTYESELLYHSYCPGHVQKPIAWGHYENSPETWFYLCDFYDMDSNLKKIPDPESFVSIIVDVHQTSMLELAASKDTLNLNTKELFNVAYLVQAIELNKLLFKLLKVLLVVRIIENNNVIYIKEEDNPIIYVEV
jgi:hypothetical protein